MVAIFLSGLLLTGFLTTATCLLRTTAGSILTALIAGTSPHKKVKSSRERVISKMKTKSMCVSSPVSTMENNREIQIPTPTPTNAGDKINSKVSLRMRRIMSSPVAPTALWSPISLLRRRTIMSCMPMIPSAVTSSAVKAKIIDR